MCKGILPICWVSGVVYVCGMPGSVVSTNLRVGQVLSEWIWMALPETTIQVAIISFYHVGLSSCWCY